MERVDILPNLDLANKISHQRLPKIGSKSTIREFEALTSSLTILEQKKGRLRFASLTGARNSVSSKD